MKRALITAVAGAGGLIVLFASADAKYNTITAVRLHQGVEIAAPPAAVWSFVTAGKNFATWNPAWKGAKNAALTLSKVGDTVDFTDSWGNTGRAVVTYTAKNRELRFAQEPDKGDYMCQTRVVLVETPKGTKAEYSEQYTDESAITDLEATAAQVESEMAAALAAIKKGVERK